MDTYLGEKSVVAIDGSWLAPRDLIQAGKWTEITARAKQAADIVRQIRAAK